MTITITELNERTGVASKLSYIASISSYINQHQHLSVRELQNIRDAYILQGGLSYKNPNVFDEHGYRCEELGIGQDSVVDDHKLIPNVDTYDKFQTYVFNAAINNSDKLAKLRDNVLNQAVEYAETVGYINMEDSHFDYPNEKENFDKIFDTLVPEQLIVTEGIQKMFPTYHISENDNLKLVDTENNNVILLNTHGFVGIDFIDNTSLSANKECVELLISEMTGTKNTVALAYFDKYTQWNESDVCIHHNLPPEEIKSIIDSEHAFSVDQIKKITPHNEMMYVEDHNPLANGLSDLSELEKSSGQQL